MNITPTSVLVARLKELIAQERAVTVRQIEYLEEIDRRKAYFDLGYNSLWDFMIQELGLSSGSAQRRKDAMRLSRDEPSVKEKLFDGSLTLTNAAKVQAFRRRTGKRHDPRELIAQVANLTQDDCTRKLLEIAPEALPRERMRIVAPEARELRVVISEELHHKLERIKGLLAHAKPNASYAELLEHLADQEIARLEKTRGLMRARDPRGIAAVPDAVSQVKTAMPQASDMSAKVTATVAVERKRASRAKPALKIGKRVHLPLDLQRRVWREAQGRCQLCTSTYQLEIDHVVPISQGGSNERENLRLLCR